MLRDLMVQAKTTAKGYCQSDEIMATGKAVIRTSTGFAYPGSATAAELFFVQKARIPVGINTARNQFSDYNAAFLAVAEDDYIIANKYAGADIFGTDAIAAVVPRTGYAVMADTDGNLAFATMASKYLCDGVYSENGHTLMKIRMLKEAKTNSTVRTVTIATPSHGTVTVVSTYPYRIAGDVVTISYVPASGYTLDAITVVDSSSGSVTVANNKFTMPDKNVTVTVTFKYIDYTVTITEPTNGTVSVAGAGGASPYNIGEVMTITATPGENFAVDTITVVDEDEAEITVTENAFAMPASNVTVTVTFVAA